MANKNKPSGKQVKKPAQPVPEIPDLGKLHKPRKGNRRAAKLIESGVRLWDKRHSERKARRRAIAQQEAYEQRREGARNVDSFIERLLKAAPNWKPGEGRVHIAPQNAQAVQFEELIKAIEGAELYNPEERSLSFYISGLTQQENISLRAALPKAITSRFAPHEQNSASEGL